MSVRLDVALDHDALIRMFRWWDMPRSLDHPWTSKPARGEVVRGGVRFVADDFSGTIESKP